jgi:membrane protease YdiL (CAAX protease family)
MPIKPSMASSHQQNNTSELEYAAHNRKHAHKRILAALSALDVTGIPIYIAWFIWRGQFVSPRSWFGFPMWLVASFLLHRDNPKTLGTRADNLWPATKQAAIVYGIFAIGLLLTGIALRQGSLLPPNYRSFGRMWVYFAFCLLQQIALNSFLTNRLVSLISRRWLASIVAGAIFAALHWPNPVLVPLTFIGGTAMAWMFARVRNILPLAAGQALLGSLAWWAFPIAWHHMLRVGPGYYLPIVH